LDFIEPVQLASRYFGNQYILVVTNSIIKWVKARALCTNTTIVSTKFLYDHILMRFGCPLTIVTDQSTHFIINDVICYLTNYFILKHTNSTVYYPQRNGEAKSTNKKFGTLLMKLVNEN
jgi:hypothetical protein